MMSVVGMFQGRRAVVADEGEAAAAGQRQENQLLRPLTKFPSTFVLDCEVVAVDSTTGALLSMQSMGARGTRLCVFAFDLLVCNGEALVGLSLRERRERLRREFGVELGRFQLVESTDILATSGAAIDLEEAAGGGAAAAVRQPAARGRWHRQLGARYSRRWADLRARAGALRGRRRGRLRGLDGQEPGRPHLALRACAAERDLVDQTQEGLPPPGGHGRHAGCGAHRCLARQRQEGGEQDGRPARLTNTPHLAAPLN
jgi:hypothetical protein